jgi:hypothetical protein
MNDSPPIPESIALAYEKARNIKKQNEEMLMAKTNVIGVGIGLQTDTVVLIVLVRKIIEHPHNENEIIPSEIDGLPVSVRAIGDIKAQ